MDDHGGWRADRLRGPLVRGRPPSGECFSRRGTLRVGRGIDRFRDDLWKLSIRAAEQAEHHAEAEQARAHHAVLEEIGVTPTDDG
ncbi:MAG: hypothetical protein ACR2MN_03420 [Acidimicrobiales bacterium]